jgi:hypothetical protein
MGKELCKHPRALIRFLKYRKEDIYAQRQTLYFKGQPFGEFSERSLGFLNDNRASEDDFKERIIEQNERYRQYLREGRLTREWAAYGRKHGL